MWVDTQKSSSDEEVQVKKELPLRRSTRHQPPRLTTPQQRARSVRGATRNQDLGSGQPARGRVSHAPVHASVMERRGNPKEDEATHTANMVVDLRKNEFKGTTHDPRNGGRRWVRHARRGGWRRIQIGGGSADPEYPPSHKGGGSPQLYYHDCSGTASQVTPQKRHR